MNFPSAERISLGVALVSAFAAAASAVFSGLQTRSLNRTLNSPFEANLQSRQIDACADYLMSEASLANLLGELESQDSRRGFPGRTVLPESDSEVIQAVRVLSSESLLTTDSEAMSRFNEASTILRVYSDTRVSEQIDLAISELAEAAYLEIVRRNYPFEYEEYDPFEDTADGDFEFGDPAPTSEASDQEYISFVTFVRPVYDTRYLELEEELEAQRAAFTQAFSPVSAVCYSAMRGEVRGLLRF